MLDALWSHLRTLLALGAMAPVLHLIVEWEEQCNFEFSLEELRAIADLGISLTVSCYEAKSSR